MGAFFQVIGTALIAAMLAPYFSQFLDVKKSKREKRLQYLEEVYELGKKVNSYSRRFPGIVTLMIAVQENNIDKDNIPKLEDSPFIRLSSLLDYHLFAPHDLVKKADTVDAKLLWSFRPIAEAITKPQDKAELYAKALKDALDAAEMSVSLSDEIIKWIKEEKLTIESQPTHFELAYWKNLCLKCWHWIKMSLEKFRPNVGEE